MTPHKDPAILPIDDRLKLFQNEVSAQGIKLQVVHNELKILRTEVKDVKTEVKHIGKKFDDLDQKLFNWKSEIHDLIDEGFTSKAKVHDEEISILNNRTVELRNNVDKLNVAVFPN